MAASKQPNFTLETSSGEGLDEEPTSRGEAKWRRFHPLRVVRKIFRRRLKRDEASVSDASKKSWSTSELQTGEDERTRKSQVTPLKIGLSVSHDSIFSSENNGRGMSSESIDVPHCSSLSVQPMTTKNMFKDELFSRVRARRDSDGDDGLPESFSPSPTATDILSQTIKDTSSKSIRTCSVGSLISMGSSENDEDSAGHSSGHSSRMSLIDRRSLESVNINNNSFQDGEIDPSQLVPLNHNAARHKIAIKPRRTYGLPRRRMNQVKVAAQRFTTLPSTPEVFEDNGKRFQQNRNSIEMVKTFSEFSTVSLNEISMATVESSLLKVSHVSSSFSYNEMSALSNEVLAQTENLVSKSVTTQYKEKTIRYPNSSNQDQTKRLETQFFLSSAQKKQTDYLKPEKTDVFECNVSDMPAIAFDSQLDPSESQPSNMQNTDTSKNNFPENLTDLTENNSFFTRNEISKNVFSLVRDVKKSEYIKKSEKSPIPIDIKTFNGKTVQKDSIPFKATCDKLEDRMEIMHECDKNDIAVKTIRNIPENVDSITRDTESKSQSTQEVSVNKMKKSATPENLNIESEFILKPLDRERSPTDSISRSREKLTDKESAVSASYFPEECIMSDKSVSKRLKESGILISHHSSSKDDFENLLVTEAHNFAAVDDKCGLRLQVSEKDNDKTIENSKPWISSVGIMSSVVPTTAVTVSSSTSTVYNKIVEDKIRISVNSNSENEKKVCLPFEASKFKQPLCELQNEPTKSSQLNVIQRTGSDEKQLCKIIDKSYSDMLSNRTSVRNENTQKRLSVEVLPFNQRNKERKSLTGANKDGTEHNKKNSNVTVERKLSDRKIAVKNKETEKPATRHSFSGALVTDKKLENEKKKNKSDKFQTPVQIRIHKSGSKPEVKEKGVTHFSSSTSFKKPTVTSLLNDTKFHINAAKPPHTESKLTMEEKSSRMSKWEVNIQPTVLSSKNNSENNLRNDSFSSMTSDINHTDDLNSSLQQGNHIQSLSEISKNPDIRKLREGQPAASDDPEPELLRVFARRSIKQKHCDKGKEETTLITFCDTSLEDSVQLERSDNSKEIIRMSQNTIIKIPEITKLHIVKTDSRKKSKSFSEKEKLTSRSVSPLKEINLIRRESSPKLVSDTQVSNDILHSKQRLASAPHPSQDLPPEITTHHQKESNAAFSVSTLDKEEISPKICLSSTEPNSTVKGNSTGMGIVKENQEILNDKDPHAPSWLQLAQQRRELREQRERLLLGGSPNSFMDGSNKPSRSSKVWDMVNNFQKLQMT